jgi:hypothetical protein
MMAQIKIIRWLICGMAIFLLMLPGAALAHGEAEGAIVKIGGYRVSLFFPEPAKAGGNPLHVQILDETGKPVNGARVDISAMPIEDWRQHRESMKSSAPGMDGVHEMNPASANDMAGMHDMTGMHDMPGMQDMAGMAAVPKVTLFNELYRKTGEYFGVIAFPSAGHWILNTHFSINGQMLNAAFPVDVAKGSTAFVILAGFAGLNALIIWVASVTKRKPVIA